MLSIDILGNFFSSSELHELRIEKSEMMVNIFGYFMVKVNYLSHLDYVL